MKVRRFYLLKRLAARRVCEEEGVWISKQAEQPGAELPADFPFLSALAAAGYSTAEDLQGACVDELYESVGLAPREARAVLEAAAAIST